MPDGNCRVLPASLRILYFAFIILILVSGCSLEERYMKELQEQVVTVTFNTNGGSSVPRQTVNKRGKVNRPSVIPVKNEFMFGGWYIEEDCIHSWDFSSDIVTANTTLYARWVLAGTLFNITFDAAGGAPVPLQQEIEIGNLVNKPPDPSNGSYLFGGWYEEPGCINLWYFDYDTVADDITLYAKWVQREQPFTLRFISDDLRIGSDIDVRTGDLITGGIPELQKPHYTITGWYTEPSLRIKWEFATDVILGNTTLYAKWEPVKYTITFDDMVSLFPEKKDISYNSLITEPNEPVNGDFTLDGWYREVEFTTKWDFGNDVVEGPMTLYAKWGYAVVFFANEGEPAPERIVIISGEKLTQPLLIERSGCTLEGWYTEEVFETKWDFNTAVTEHIDLFARWTVTVSYNRNGGSGTTPVSITVTVGDEITLPSDTGFSYTNWYFNGWNTMADGTGTNYESESDYSATETIILYAKWESILYNVTFEANGGYPVPENQEVVSGTRAVIPMAMTNSTNPGYVMGGWYRDPDFTTKWNFASNTITGDITLYARWGSGYNVDFYANGGSPSPSRQVVSAGNKADQPPSMSRSGCSFDQWYTTSGFTSGTTWNFDTVVSEDIRLYGRWTIRVQFYNYNSSGIGPSAMTVTADYGESIVIPSYYQMYYGLLGHTFLGWNTRTDGAGTNYAPGTYYTPTANITLYDNWRHNVPSASGMIPMSAGVWKSGQITDDQGVWFTFNVTAGTNYIWWNDYDAYNGRPLDIYVHCYLNDILMFSYDAGWTTPASVLATSSGTIKLRAIPRVIPSGDSSRDRGAFDIVFRTVDTRPDYSNSFAPNTWITGSLKAGEVYYLTFSGVTLRTYTVEWDDSDRNNSGLSLGYPADIKVGVRRLGYEYYPLSVGDYASTNKQSYTVNTPGTYVIEVYGYSGSSSGDFRIRQN